MENLTALNTPSPIAPTGRLARLRATLAAAKRAPAPTGPMRLVHQAGMTLVEIMIVLAILALVMGLLVGPRVMEMFGESKVDLARSEAGLFVGGYQQWARANPTKSCPSSIKDLTKYMNRSNVDDPWGNPYVMLCGDKLPAGVRGGIAIFSAGPDSKPNTADDIQSWEKEGDK